MALVSINKRLPYFIALSSDIVTGKIPGLGIVGARVFLTDTQAWKVTLPDLTLADYTEGGGGTSLTKATGAEINTGTDDAKYVTPKAIADSNVAFVADIPVKATGAEINTGTDDAKFATAKAITDSNVAFTTDIPVKASGAEINTGTDDAKFATAKAIADSILRKNQALFMISSTLTTSTGALRVYNNYGGTVTITGVMISVATAPTGANILVDVNKNGTTIFTTQSNRPTILASQNTGSTSTVEVPAWAANEYLTVDVDQIGSTIAGADLTVHVLFTK